MTIGLPRRLTIVKVTIGLALAGAIAGAVAAMVGLTAMMAFMAIGGNGGAIDGETYAYAAAVGSVLGIVIGPVTAWSALRHVPIGKSIVWVTIGAVCGAWVGLLAQAAVPGFLAGWFRCALGGVAIAAARLRSGYSRFSAGRLVVAEPARASARGRITRGGAVEHGVDAAAAPPRVD